MTWNGQSSNKRLRVASELDSRISSRCDPRQHARVNVEWDDEERSRQCIQETRIMRGRPPG
jgi:hypothetical protein